jgi:uncharacterized protein YbaA (DUF1428 family)
MAYVDLMVSPVPSKRLDEYKKLAKKSARLWKKYGVTGYMELLAQDAKPGKVTSFPQSVKLKKGEVVACTVIVYKSRKHRDGVWGKIMKDPFFANYDMKKAPFDAQRMFFGGFTTITAF